ncbi:hypothetical protein HDZ31DRAFT_16436, partial [Schizophyllum fasciatum]
MADQSSRRSPRFQNSTPRSSAPTASPPPATNSSQSSVPTGPRTRRAHPPSQLSLPPATASLPTPLPSSSIKDSAPGLLPAAHIASYSAPTNCPVSRARTPTPHSSPSPLVSPAASVYSDDMPPSELAPGITIYAPGKLPTVEDSRLAAQSLADPRNCTRLVSKIRAYAKAHNLEDGAFMESAVHAFESPKMLADFRQAAARLDMTVSDLTFAQLETVLKAAFMRGSTVAFVDNFRAMTRLPSESPHDFLDRIEETNCDVPKAQRDSQEELIRRTSKSFGTGFKNFCFLNSQFKDLTDWAVPEVVDGDDASIIARDASVGNFKSTLDLAWNLYVSSASDRESDLQAAIDAVLAKRGITSDSRKRGLSATSHVAQLPDPKRSTSFSSNAAGGSRNLPLMPRLATVNTIGYGGGSRARNDLRGHRETLVKYNGCFTCFMLFADHGSRACPYGDAAFQPPNFDLNSAGVHQIIEEELLPHNERKVTLADLIGRINRRHSTTGSAAATAPNNIPVSGRVNAVPTAPAHISPDSSYEG